MNTILKNMDNQSTTPATVEPSPTVTPPPNNPKPAFQIKSLLPVLVLVLMLPVLVASTQLRKLVGSRASTALIGSVKINPEGIITSPGARTINLSAMAFDGNNQPINQNVNYIWGMSSTNSIGTLKPNTDDSKLAQFTPSTNAGVGDIYVEAFLGAEKMRTSIPVRVDLDTGTLPTPTPGITNYPTPTNRPTPIPTTTTIIPTRPSTVTPTKYISPTFAPTATPIPVQTNNQPTITTSILVPPYAVVGRQYKVKVYGSDRDTRDTLRMTVTSSPTGVSLFDCAQNTTANPTTISCTMGVLALRSGTYSIVLTLTDNHGGRVQRNFTLPTYSDIRVFGFSLLP